VFLINVPLASVTIGLTLYATPALRPRGGERVRIDYLGTITFGLGIAAFIYGLSQVQDSGWGSGETVVSMGAGVLLLATFVAIEFRVESPLLEFRLFRHANLLAANIRQLLAGSIELGLGFLMPFFLLLVIGIGPGHRRHRADSRDDPDHPRRTAGRAGLRSLRGPDSARGRLPGAGRRGWPSPQAPATSPSRRSSRVFCCRDSAWALC